MGMQQIQAAQTFDELKKCVSSLPASDKQSATDLLRKVQNEIAEIDDPENRTESGVHFTKVYLPNTQWNQLTEAFKGRLLQILDTIEAI